MAIKIHGGRSLHGTALAICLFICAASSNAQVRRDDSNIRLLPLAVKAADPFYVVTGIYSRAYADLFVKDSVPIQFSRTQRNMDPKSRSFGIGGSTSYDMFII